jgi:hypothetical protein
MGVNLGGLGVRARGCGIICISRRQPGALDQLPGTCNHVCIMDTLFRIAGASRARE